MPSARSEVQAAQVLDSWSADFEDAIEIASKARIQLKKRLAMALDESFADGMKCGENLARLERVHPEM